MRLLANEAAALQAKLLRCEPRPKRPAIRRAHVRRRHLASAGGESPPAYHRARRRLHPLQFIEYIVRGPLSNERLEIQTNGDVKLALKTQWAAGVTHLLLSPEECRRPPAGVGGVCCQKINAAHPFISYSSAYSCEWC